ncbi:hypothetical protein [uncultured Microbacterium sp.]|uniref:hypothetical protein n=1 Tax=uncultured Microbacterium sp. TaxID=191216 RepID=UPI0025D12773|nr:hypothetical protein [uncultured Microbacterium sp.]
MRSPLTAVVLATLIAAPAAVPALVPATEGAEAMPRVAAWAVSEAGRSPSAPALLLPSAGVVDDGPAQSDPDPEAEAGRLAFVIVPLLAAVVVVVGAIVVIARGRRGRRGD